MVHHKRTYNVAKVDSVDELANKLTRCTWTLCTGFELEGYLFLNDSFTEDSRQVESITFGWCDRDRTAQHIHQVLAGEHVDVGPVQPRTNHGKACHLCR